MLVRPDCQSKVGMQDQCQFFFRFHVTIRSKFFRKIVFKNDHLHASFYVMCIDEEISVHHLHLNLQDNKYSAYSTLW